MALLPQASFPSPDTLLSLFVQDPPGHPGCYTTTSLWMTFAFNPCPALSGALPHRICVSKEDASHRSLDTNSEKEPQPSQPAGDPSDDAGVKASPMSPTMCGRLLVAWKMLAALAPATATKSTLCTCHGSRALSSSVLSSMTATANPTATTMFEGGGEGATSTVMNPIWSAVEFRVQPAETYKYGEVFNQTTQQPTCHPLPSHPPSLRPLGLRLPPPPPPDGLKCPRLLRLSVTAAPTSTMVGTTRDTHPTPAPTPPPPHPSPLTARSTSVVSYGSVRRFYCLTSLSEPPAEPPLAVEHDAAAPDALPTPPTDSSAPDMMGCRRPYECSRRVPLRLPPLSDTLRVDLGYFNSCVTFSDFKYSTSARSSIKIGTRAFSRKTWILNQHADLKLSYSQMPQSCTSKAVAVALNVYLEAHTMHPEARYQCNWPCQCSLHFNVHEFNLNPRQRLTMCFEAFIPMKAVTMQYEPNWSWSRNGMAILSLPSNADAMIVRIKILALDSISGHLEAVILYIPILVYLPRLIKTLSNFRTDYWAVAPTWVESRHQDLGHVTAIRLASNHHHDTSKQLGQLTSECPRMQADPFRGWNPSASTLSRLRNSPLHQFRQIIMQDAATCLVPLRRSNDPLSPNPLLGTQPLFSGLPEVMHIMHDDYSKLFLLSFKLSIQGASFGGLHWSFVICPLRYSATDQLWNQCFELRARLYWIPGKSTATVYYKRSWRPISTDSGRSKRVPAPFFALCGSCIKKCDFPRNYRPTPPRDLDQLCPQFNPESFKRSRNGSLSVLYTGYNVCFGLNFSALPPDSWVRSSGTFSDTHQMLLDAHQMPVLERAGSEGRRWAARPLMQGTDSHPSPRMAGRARATVVFEFYCGSPRPHWHQECVPATRAVQLPSQDELYRSMAIEGDPRNESESFSPPSAALQLTGIIDLTGTSGTSALPAFALFHAGSDILLHGFRRLFKQCTAVFPAGRTAHTYVFKVSIPPRVRISPKLISGHFVIQPHENLRNPLEARGDLARHPEGSSATLRTALMARHDFTARPRLVRLTHSASQTYQGL
ncbi:hypothetical protein FB451DRAFT_1174128, partial [Mycena latifolia]